MPDVPVCAYAEMLWVSIGFPDCWDGVLTEYPTSGGQDAVFPPRDDPSEAHADFWNTWDQDRLEEFVRDCINPSVNCRAYRTGEG